MSASFFIVLLTWSLASAQQESSSPGLTRDYCQSPTDCQAPRTCYLLQNATRLAPDTQCPAFDACRCVPPTYIHCQAASDCSGTEICARTVLFPFVCTSSVHVDSLKGRVVTIDESRSDPLVPMCAPPSTPVDAGSLRENGLVLDACNPGTCADGLSCVFPRGDGKFQCCADGECLCHAPDTRPVCESTTDCNDGEVCGIGRTLPQQCYGRRWMRTNQPALWRSLKIITASPTPQPGSGDGTVSPTGGDEAATPAPGDVPAPSEDGIGQDGEPEEAICVDAEALSHLPTDQLVFEKPRLGRVLCDIDGSCATPGHIVKFKGTAMMMRSYCVIAGCVDRVMRVNSVRYRKGLLTKSKTLKLEYTAFAARYATRAEEGVLATAVRFGF